MEKIGFHQSRADHTLFTYNTQGVFLATLIYVDDVILAGNKSAFMQQVKSHLDRELSIKDSGTLKYFMGIEVARSAKGIVLNQGKYDIDILKETRMQHCRPSKIPMEQHCNLRANEDETDVGICKVQKDIRPPAVPHHN